MKFSDMTIPQAQSWLTWARDHDWGTGANYAHGQMIGLVEREWDADKQEATDRLVTFDNPRDLRAWAGY